MLVTGIEVCGFRNLAPMRLELGAGVISAVGENGAGKTNLLEALYFGLSGRSFRTRDRRELVCFGEPAARVEVDLRAEDGSAHSLLASVSRSEGRRHLIDGEAAAPQVIGRRRPHLVVFSPDRLLLVKGPPSERRAHLDGFIAARWPARSELRVEYGQALAQRNALLRRAAAGQAPEQELDAWDAALVGSAAPLIEARSEAVAELADSFAASAATLGLDRARLRYCPSEDDPASLRNALIERRASDLTRIRTSLGPHLDEVALEREGRSVRRYGSQGEQRAALLALLFAEREALLAADSMPPLMLLDDVMSELDPQRRDLLAAKLAHAGQALISAADVDSLPAAARHSLVMMPTGAATLRAVA